MRRWLSTVVAAVIGGGATAGALLAAGAVGTGKEGAAGGVRLAGAARAGGAAGAAGAALEVREIFRRAAPGVVFVRAQRLPGEPTPFDAAGTAGQIEMTGAGFLIDEHGLMLTNAHVIAAATDIRVTLSGTHTVGAMVVGKDPDIDLALLRIDHGGRDLEPLELADSESVGIGDPTIAIGSPSESERTLATGVVSVLRRRLTSASGFTIDDVLQTDAALEPSYAGGPLLDATGRVIGINSQIASGAAGVETGFAVPVDIVEDVIPQLEATGHVER